MPRDPTPDWVHTRRRQIGDRLRHARKTVGLTQETLAERIGRDRKSVIRWENGYSVPDLEDLLLIADALDVPLSQLVAEE